MSCRPRPRASRCSPRPVMVTVGLVGTAMTIGLLSMIEIGTRHFHSTGVGTSIAFTAFALCLIVAALECRSETDSILTSATFESRQMNRTIILEFVLAVLTTQMDALRRILGTTQLTFREFTWALVPMVGLFLLWELGKLVARRFAGTSLPALAPPVGA